MRALRSHVPRVLIAVVLVLIAGSYPLWKGISADSPGQSAPALQFSTAAEVIIPRNGQLKSVSVSRATSQDMMKAHGNRISLLNEVIRLSPREFPPGARVLSVGRNELMMPTKRPRHWVPAYFEIDLNKAFANQAFWRRQGKRRTNAAFHALARNVAFQNQPKGGAMPVQFLIEERGAGKLGGFDASQILMPEKIMGVR